MIIPPNMPLSDGFWHFAYWRHRKFMTRFQGKEDVPDPTLDTYSFTNAYRVNDRTTQYLLQNVQHVHQGDWMTVETLVFRTLLFKLFNRISTWEFLAPTFDLHPNTYDWRQYAVCMRAMKAPPFSAAYMVPFWTTPSGYQIEKKVAMKVERALQMLDYFIKTSLPSQLLLVNAVRGYEILTQQPNIGPFLAYQFVTDLGYLRRFEWDECELVIPGPQAKEGIQQAYNTDRYEYTLRKVQGEQEEEFEKRDIPIVSLFGRPLQLIDIQNLFCEYAKYLRLSGRVKENKVYFPGTDRKKRYRLYKPNPVPLQYIYPPQWGLEVPSRG